MPEPLVKKSEAIDQSRRYSKRVMNRGSGAYSNVKVYSFLSERQAHGNATPHRVG